MPYRYRTMTSLLLSQIAAETLSGLKSANLTSVRELLETINHQFISTMKLTGMKALMK